MLAPADQRTWGDGGGKRRVHEIEAMSYELGIVICATDRAAVRFGDVPPDVAWDMHRGLLTPPEQRVIDRAAQATDAEVEEFLRSLAGGGDGSLPPTLSRSVAYAADHATGNDDGVDIEAMLIRLREMQARCTCDDTDVMVCPNYVDGDEETIE